MSHLAICFIIMPFGKKPDMAGREIDFDRIYKEIIEPAVKEVGFESIRADEEVNAGLIHKAMYERLMLSEFAIADLSLFNPNVYYELGVRHVMRPQSTVLMAADASRLPFDVSHLRTLTYSLDDRGEPKDAAGDRVKLVKRLNDTKQDGKADSPLFKLMIGLKPPEIAHSKTDVFRNEVTYSQDWKAKLAKARSLAGKERLAALDQIRTDLGDISVVQAGVVIDLLLSYRGISAWDKVIELYEAMDPVLRQSTLTREQYGMALNRAGRSKDAETVLCELIKERGPSSETYGLLGRVYKDRWEAAKKANDIGARGWADKAIKTYISGFEADWRDAYPGVNAVNLLALTNPKDPRIAELAPVVRYAVERKIARGTPDYWDYATLIELAVIAGDLDAATELLPDAIVKLEESGEGWNAKTTADSLERIRSSWQAAGKEDARLDTIIAELLKRAG
jgi:hypothetical protein